MADTVISDYSGAAAEAALLGKPVYFFVPDTERYSSECGINVNPLGVNAVARIGINDFGIIARYSFTSLFLNDDPVQTYPFMIGLSTTF